ncbi:MAG: 2-hydroxyacid dehydrogenase [Gammaproteobacteria bacterium]|nr:2-hydroxyacid dehydrogenase [Gammaproteobacteria bacterium]
MLGVFLDFETMAAADLDLGAFESALPEWRLHEATAADEVRARIQGATVVVVNKVVLDAACLQNAPDLRLVCIAATGTNNVDLAAARAAGVTVCNVRGYSTASVSQHTFALILALATRLIDYDAAVRAGRWQRSRQFCFLDYPITELAGRTLGIVGYGELGRAVARLGEAFGMRILLAERPGGPAQPGRLPLEELLPQVDVLSLHCPLTEHTRGLIGREALARMPSHAVLINTARGGIVDESALAAALREGRIGGAGVDVLSTEPPREGNPLLEEDIPNLIVTPHSAWGSHAARQRVIDEVVRLIERFLAGRPDNIVA